MRALIVVVLASFAGCVRAPLTGTWTLVAADEVRPDGSRFAAYGERPRGRLQVDAAGRYSLQIYRGDRPTFASGDKKRGTPGEYESAVLGMSAHLGHCAISPEGHTLIFHIESSAFPNWEGTEQRREFTLEDETLSYRLPASASGNVPITVWRRVTR